MIEVFILFGIDLFGWKDEDGKDGLGETFQLQDQGGVVDEAQVAVEEEDVHLDLCWIYGVRFLLYSGYLIQFLFEIINYN